MNKLAHISSGYKLFSLILYFSLLAATLGAGRTFPVEAQSVHLANQRGISNSLISNNRFLYSSTTNDFDIQNFLNQHNGPLKNFSESIDGQDWGAAETIKYNAVYYGINPQVLLLLLEAETGLITQAAANVPLAPDPLAGSRDGSKFYFHVKWLAEGAAQNFYLRRDHLDSSQVHFASGEAIDVDPEINAGTYGLLGALAQILPDGQWPAWTSGEPTEFDELYLRWFGDPLADLDAGELAVGMPVLPDDYNLPFPVGESWYYTSGPHNYAGGTVGCTSGSDCPRPWSSIDIAPPESTSCPGDNYAENRWIIAARAGKVEISSTALVVIDHPDGWKTYYSHVATADRRAVGPINQGDPVGHPSCEVEPGGSTTGIHLHFAIYKEGTGFIDISGSSLSDWLITETSHYNGAMTRLGIVRTADASRSVGTNDILNDGSRVLTSLIASTPTSLWQIDPDTGSTSIKNHACYQVTDVAFDGNTLYAVSFSQLLKIDPFTGACSAIGYIGNTNINSQAVTRDGKMYAASSNGEFYTLNKVTGTGTFLGSFGAGLGSSGDLAIDFAGNMYAPVMRSGYSNDWLARIDISNGQATPIYDLGEAGTWGLDFRNGILYGVTSSGHLLEIDPSTGIIARKATFSGEFWGLSTNARPVVNYVDRAGSDPAGSTYLNFSVTFSEPVTGVNTAAPFSDFALSTTGVTGASITKVTGSGAAYTVTVNTGRGNGTIRLDVVNDGSVKDVANIPLVGKGNSIAGETYILNQGANITIGAQFIGNYSVLPTPATIINRSNMVDGPVRVTSARGGNLFTSERVISGTSFNEVMGYPANQLTTEYWFPWYDNIDMATWVLVGNASSTQAATVDIYIGGVKRGSYNIPIGGRVTPRFSLQTGPVRVVSTNRAKIFTSERTQYGPNNAFNEVMGYPADQFTTEYWFPWYDNSSMYTWILVGNPSTTSSAVVDIYIGGVKRNSYVIPKGGQITPRFNVMPTGPVRVVSTNGVKIFTSERTVAGDSFNEVMGYPASQFTSEYWYPWYDNVSMATWVLVGNPTTSTAKVDIYVGGVKQGSYTIGAGKQINQRFNLNTGPVHVVSTNGAKIFTSERVLLGTSFNEVMGYPGNKLTAEYWFPWYDSSSMSTDIVVGTP
jgi:hypothetical protein